MKVLFVTHYTSLYGANRSLLNLLDGLQAYGVEPLIILPNTGELTEECTRRNIPFKVVLFHFDFVYKERFEGIKAKINLIRLSLFNIKQAFNLYSAIRKEKPALVYSNSSVVFSGFYLSHFLRVPHVWHIREFAEDQYKLHPVLGYSVFKSFLKSTSSTIFVSNALRNFYFPHGLKNSHVIYNGIATKDEFVRNKKKNCRSGSEFIFCIVGLIDPEKGQLEAIMAFEELGKRYKNIKLHIAGGGDVSELEQYIKKNSIDGIKFFGQVRDPFEIFSRSNATLMCSRNEAMGRVTVESMCCKTPVIGRNSGGTSELIIHNETGLLYDGSVEDLVDQMEVLIIHKEKGSQLAERAWEWAYANVTQEKYTESVYKTLKNVV